MQMKSKKFFYINIVLLLVNVLLIGSWAFSPDTSVVAPAFQPVRIKTRDDTSVGQFRLSKRTTTDMLTALAENSPIKLDFKEIAEGESSEGEGYVSIKAKQTVKMEGVQHYTNYQLLHFCEEDGFWYLVYSTNYMARAVGYPAASQDPVNFDVPADVLSDPGQYAITIEGLGCCLFEIS